ncbi:LamG-like jellyroll fold domain-containing protein [Sphingomonas silueang]|uniref:LamG-like jellyroll fold domain-containing protein n=1 Tax=Sphingomonas silueang TaxID=3156617 RepID=UPI0032B55F3C
MTRHLPRIAATIAALLAGAAHAQGAPGGDDLLFRVSADRTLDADVSGGEAKPNFRSNVTIVPDGAIGGAARWADDGYVAWKAPGNMHAARGTLSFFWRSRTPVGEAPFVIFRAGYADHSSWDMAFLRIDWNGHGFDAFVTDANLSRVRVSFRIDRLPSPAAWSHIAFGWDETQGVRLYVDGREVARNETKADLDASLDSFGLAGRVLSPHQVQSRYNFMRGSDLDEIRVYGRMLDAAGVAALAAKRDPQPVAADPATGQRAAWLHRYGWDNATPPLLDAATTIVRKVEFADAKDLKQWMWKGVDGIAETTWPGVYNRSRLPGRNDYFQLPDWNTYVEGGKTYALTVPEGVRFNRVEVRGAAYGTLDWRDGGDSTRLATRPRGVVRSVDQFAPRTGGVLRFTNVMQEQPIQEIWAYDVAAGKVPQGSFQLDYTIRSALDPDLAILEPLNRHITGRYAPDERTTVLAMPTSGVKAAVGAGAAGGTAERRAQAGAAPIVHVLIPASFGPARPDGPVARAWDYGWQNIHDGLDGIAIELPALKGTGPIPLNIRVKDPIWPDRDMIDLSVSVPAGQARTLFLDLRDRILSADSLYLSIASALPGFGAESVDGTRIRLVFKPRGETMREHVADRFNQVRDNWGYLVEEHTASRRMPLYDRLYRDISDLLRVDPGHREGRAYWADINYRPENYPSVALPAPPPGVPAWAFRQVEDLKASRRFVNWWIDHRQVPYGDFGGGISDDSDLTQQWPGLALMGVDPDKINRSLRALSDAVYRNGMITNGLSTIETDELHVYEEGLNSNAERLYLNWGEPLAVERLMDTVAGLSRVLLRNPAGHVHFASSWYGGRKIYRDEPWAWQKPYAFTVMHVPTMLGAFNAHPAAVAQVTGVMDGLLAHAKVDAKGVPAYPNEIGWTSDAERAGDGGGASVPLQTAWSAWRFTGNAKYLAPITARAARGGPGGLSELGDNLFDRLPQGADWRKALAAGKGDSDFARYARWSETGDTAPLAELHADALKLKLQQQYMLTEGHWWSDRVDSPTEMLQRERLGAVALRRNSHYPTHFVSWRFAQPDGAEQVAILLPGARPDRLRIIAHNLSGVEQRAAMTAWNVTAGEWRVTQGTSGDDGRTVTATGTPRTVTLERSGAIDLAFAPGTTSVFDLELVRATTPVEQRPDIGIGTHDVTVRGREVRLTVHGLGSTASPAGRAMLVDTAGRAVAEAAIPALDAPLDLKPRTATVRLRLPAGVAADTLTAAIALNGDAPELTRLNNRVAVKDREAPVVPDPVSR